MRQIMGRVDSLPPDAAVPRAVGNPGWNVGDYLTADVFRALTGKEHPADPRTRANRDRKTDVSTLRDARTRHRQRRERLGITGSVLRKGV